MWWRRGSTLNGLTIYLSVLTSSARVGEGMRGRGGFDTDCHIWPRRLFFFSTVIILWESEMFKPLGMEGVNGKI